MKIPFEKRAICSEKDRSLFSSRFTVDPAAMWALTDRCASEFWKDIISTRHKKLPRLLPASHWSNQSTLFGPNWYNHWNNPEPPDLVADFLRTNITWSGNNGVYVVMDGSTVYVMNWEIFIAYWRPLASGEDLIAIRLGSPEFVRFTDSGVLFVGRRETNFLA